MFLKYEIPYSDIIDVQIKNKIPFYIGWGLRINPFSRTLYFVLHHGKNVRIRRKNGFWRNIVLSVNNPEKFISTVKKHNQKLK